MTETSSSVNITLLGKDYLVACNEQERILLNDAVALLSRKMQEIKDTGKTIGSERVAVLAALNIAHEMLSYRQKKESYTSDVESMIQRLRYKIDDVLVSDIPADLETVNDI